MLRDALSIVLRFTIKDEFMFEPDPVYLSIYLYIYLYRGGFIREACQFKKTRGRISATHLRLRWTQSRRIDAIHGRVEIIKGGTAVKAVFIDRMSG